MTPLAKTTGHRGIHIYCRLRAPLGLLRVRAAAVALARELERRRPELVHLGVVEGGARRAVFVDYNQNAPHKTVFAAWGARARVGGQVSTPFAWDELETIEPDELTIATVPARVAGQGDPWATIVDHAEDLSSLLERSAHDLASGMMDAPWPPV